jgi:hypothetical protein
VEAATAVVDIIWSVVVGRCAGVGIPGRIFRVFSVYLAQNLLCTCRGQRVALAHGRGPKSSRAIDAIFRQTKRYATRSIGRRSGKVWPLARQPVAKGCRSHAHCRHTPRSPYDSRESSCDALNKETPMSSIASLSSAPSALASITARPHGHKKGSQVSSTSSDSEGDAMTPVPAATQQNLFSSMLQSLEQVIGVQPATAGSASSAAPVGSTSASGSVAATAATTPASTGTAPAPITASTAAATAASNSALQKYLHNVSSQSNDLRLPTVTGSTVRASA